MTESRNYLPALDGLRAFAVLAVFGFHLTPYARSFSGSDTYSPLLQVLDLGWMGVDLFFALSGFLITTGLLHLRDLQATGRYFRLFYQKRLLRIFPLYYAVCLVVLVFWPMVQPDVVGQFPGVYAERWSFLLHVQNWVSAFTPHDSLFLSHFWSLCIEEQFYLVWPLCVLLLPRSRRGVQWCIGFAVLVFVIRMAVLQFGADAVQNRRFVYHATCCRCDTLLLGAALAYARLYCPASYNDLRTVTRWRWPLLAVAGLYLCWMFFSRGSYSSVGIPAFGGIGFSVVACAATALVWLCSLRKLDNSFLAWTPLRYLGRISYGLYVFHAPVLFFLGLRFQQSGCFGPWWPWVFTLTAFLVTLGISVFSFHCFEVVFLRMKPKADASSFKSSSSLHPAGK